jgi:hypothetical protein
VSLLGAVPHALPDLLGYGACLVAGATLPMFVSMPGAALLALVLTWIRFQTQSQPGLEMIGVFLLTLVQGGFQLALNLGLAQLGLGLSIWRSATRSPKPSSGAESGVVQTGGPSLPKAASENSSDRRAQGGPAETSSWE